MQSLGTLDGMEPVVKQISGHHGSPRFPGDACKSRTWARGRTSATPLTASASPFPCHPTYDRLVRNGPVKQRSHIGRRVTRCSPTGLERLRACVLVAALNLPAYSVGAPPGSFTSPPCAVAHPRTSTGFRQPSVSCAVRERAAGLHCQLAGRHRPGCPRVRSACAGPAFRPISSSMPSSRPVCVMAVGESLGTGETSWRHGSSRRRMGAAAGIEPARPRSPKRNDRESRPGGHRL